MLLSLSVSFEDEVLIGVRARSLICVFAPDQISIYWSCQQEAAFLCFPPPNVFCFNNTVPLFQYSKWISGILWAKLPASMLQLSWWEELLIDLQAYRVWFILREHTTWKDISKVLHREKVYTSTGSLIESNFLAVIWTTSQPQISWHSPRTSFPWSKMRA